MKGGEIAPRVGEEKGITMAVRKGKGRVGVAGVRTRKEVVERRDLSRRALKC